MQHHGCDTHLRVYEIPREHESAYGDVIFHHESDRTPIAVYLASGHTITHPTRVATKWDSLRPVSDTALSTNSAHKMQKSLQLVVTAADREPIRADVLATLSHSEEGMHGGNARNTTRVYQMARADLAPLKGVHAQKTLLRLGVTLPNNQSVPAVYLDAHPYGVGTYIAYLGQKNILTLDVDHRGAIVSGSYVECARSHRVQYEKETLHKPVTSVTASDIGISLPRFTKKSASPGQLTATQSADEQTYRRDIQNQYEVLRRNLDAFIERHSYDPKLNRFLEYQGAAATDELIAKLRRELETLERDAENYERLYKRFKGFERLVEKNIKRNYKQRVKLGGIKSRDDFKAAAKELKDIKRAIGKVKDNQKAFLREQRAEEEFARERDRILRENQQRSVSAALIQGDGDLRDETLMQRVERTAVEGEMDGRGAILELHPTVRYQIRPLAAHAPIYFARHVTGDLSFVPHI